MLTLSHNETEQRQLKLRHVFLPGGYGFAAEVIVAVTALVIFNVTELSNQLLTKNFNDADPLPVWNQIFKSILDAVQSYYIVQQVLLFVMWAIIGALLYILVFRLLQIAFGVKHSVNTGWRYMRNDHARGALHWLASLHDFFLASIVNIAGGLIVLFGSIVCFGIASQELRNALIDTFPTNAWELALALVAAILSIRFIALGLSLISSRFRDWYTT
jgi:hypothetical protein